MRQFMRFLVEYFRREDTSKLVEYVIVLALIIVGGAQVLATARKDGGNTPAQSDPQVAPVGS
jgi:hypothetical protein